MGVADDTLLWYCSDNGREGSTQQARSNRELSGGIRGRQRSLFEGGIRVPGILERPARVLGGRHTAIPCSTSGYCPTVASLLGLDVPQDGRLIDSISLVPLIDGVIERREVPLAFQRPTGGEAAVRRRFESPDHVRIGNRHKLSSYLDADRDKDDTLFDLAVDSGERHNLVAELPGLAARMKRELQDWDASCAQQRRRGLPPRVIAATGPPESWVQAKSASRCGSSRRVGRVASTRPGGSGRGKCPVPFDSGGFVGFFLSPLFEGELVRQA